MFTVNGYTVMFAGSPDGDGVVILAHDPSQVQPWVTARMGNIDETSWHLGHYYFAGQKDEAFRDWLARL